MLSKRVTLDDLLKKQSSSDFKIVNNSKGPKVRVIKKRQPKPELYVNETELKKVACDFLETLPNVKLLKTDNMALRVGNGRKAKTRNPGMADHHLCIRGIFVAIEAKMPGKGLDPDQITYRDSILFAGGIFIVYHSLHELVEEMKKHRLLSRYL